MDNNQINPNPIQAQNMPPVMQNPAPSSTGSIVATIIVIALIILGGLYFWGKRIETQKNNQKALIEMSNMENAAAVEVSSINNVSADDSLESLEAEIGATNVSSVDSNI